MTIDRMETTMPDHRPPAPIIGVYIIYIASILGDESHLDAMDPTKSTGPYPVPTFPELVQTEDDGCYDYGYLGDECDRVRYFPAGYIDSEGLTEPAECADCEGWGSREQGGDDLRANWLDCPTCDGIGHAPCGEGRHRKWAGELTADRWREFANRYIIDLDHDGVPEQYEETMGSLTELGHLDAVGVDNTEGWECPGGPDVIDSQFYVSFALAPIEETRDISIADR